MEEVLAETLVIRWSTLADEVLNKYHKVAWSILANELATKNLLIR